MRQYHATRRVAAPAFATGNIAIGGEAAKRYPLSAQLERSTRLSIVEHALADVVERLDELPLHPQFETLRKSAHQFAVEIASWEAHPPAEERRVALLRGVLDLNVEAIRAGARESQKIDASDADDEDYPKLV